MLASVGVGNGMGSGRSDVSIPSAIAPRPWSIAGFLHASKLVHAQKPLLKLIRATCRAEPCHKVTPDCHAGFQINYKLKTQLDVNRVTKIYCVVLFEKSLGWHN